MRCKERVKTLFLSNVSNHWRKFLFPIAAIGITIAFWLIPREQANNGMIAVSEESLLTELVEANTDTLNEEPLSIDTEPALIIVDVKGAVHHPGVYTLEEGDRLGDAIQAAGGYVPDADSRKLNHAMKLTDELLIYVPLIGEEPPAGEVQFVNGSETAPSGGKVNINTADEEQLMTISGIGPAKAEAIIQYRNEHGPFSTVESLMNVSGIGQKTFEKFEHQITVK